MSGPPFEPDTSTPPDRPPPGGFWYAFFESLNHERKGYTWEDPKSYFDTFVQGVVWIVLALIATFLGGLVIMALSIIGGLFW